VTARAIESELSLPSDGRVRFFAALDSGGGMNHRMKSYLVTTGTLFGLLAAAHVLRTLAERGRLAADPGFLVEGPGIGLVAAGLSFWAWRLLILARRQP
jgi:high-affinity Fe2+/Pb2+ permease